MEADTEKNFDTIAGFVLMLLGIGIAVFALKMPWVQEPTGPVFSSPGVVPLFVGIMIFLLSAVLFFQSVKKSKLSVFFSKGYLINNIIKNKNLVFTTLFTALYALLFLGRIPYMLITGLFTFVFILFFEYAKENLAAVKRKKIIVAFVISLVSSVAVFYLFEKIFLVHLP